MANRIGKLASIHPERLVIPLLRFTLASKFKIVASILKKVASILKNVASKLWLY